MGRRDGAEKDISLSRRCGLWCLRASMPTRSPSCPAIGAMCACPRRDGAEKDISLSRRGGLWSLRACMPTRSPSCPAIGAMCACPQRDVTAPRRTPFRHVEVAYGASVHGCRLGRPPAPPSGPCALVRDGAAPGRTSVSHVEVAYGGPG